jgi:apolipoprotein D and lipocalin family protein
MISHFLTSTRSAAFVRCALLIAIATMIAACATTKMHSMKSPATRLRTVPQVDLPRFMGDWRVIASIPSSADKDHVDAIESYALRPDGTIENWFTYRKKSFGAPQKTIHTQAVVVNKETNAEWRVKSYGVFAADLFVIDLEPNYQWAVIGHPSRNFGLILAREKTLPPATYENVLDRLAAQGYDPGRFVKIPQPLSSPATR